MRENRHLEERVSAIFTMVEFQGFCSREDFRELAEATERALHGWHRDQVFFDIIFQLM